MSIEISTILFTFLLIFVGVGLIYTLVGKSAYSSPVNLLFIAGIPLVIVVTSYTYRIQISSNFPKNIGQAVAASLEIAMLIVSVTSGALFSLAATNRAALKRSNRLNSLKEQLESCKKLRTQSNEDITDMLRDTTFIFSRESFMDWHAKRIHIKTEYEKKELEIFRHIKELSE